MIWGPQGCCSKCRRPGRARSRSFPGRAVPGVPRLHHRGRLAVAAALYWLIVKTRFGALVRAGAQREWRSPSRQREVVVHAGVRAGRRVVRAAGALLGPLLAVQIGMGENILIQAFVVVVIGGIGSIRGAWWARCCRDGGHHRAGVIPAIFRSFMPNNIADALGPTLAAMAVYILMAAVLYWKPTVVPGARLKLNAKAAENARKAEQELAADDAR